MPHSAPSSVTAPLRIPGIASHRGAPPPLAKSSSPISSQEIYSHTPAAAIGTAGCLSPQLVSTLVAGLHSPPTRLAPTLGISSPPLSSRAAHPVLGRAVRVAPPRAPKLQTSLSASALSDNKAPSISPQQCYSRNAGSPGIPMVSGTVMRMTSSPERASSASARIHASPRALTHAYAPRVRVVSPEVAAAAIRVKSPIAAPAPYYAQFPHSAPQQPCGYGERRTVGGVTTYTTFEGITYGDRSGRANSPTTATPDPIVFRSVSQPPVRQMPMNFPPRFRSGDVTSAVLRQRSSETSSSVAAPMTIRVQCEG